MKKRIMFTVICLFLSVVVFGSYRILNPRTAVVYAEEPLSELQYKIIEINEGDSLWSIAEENMSPGFHDIRDYIQEIRDCNQLSTDQIYAGSYLMLPYYEITNNVTSD